MCGIAGIVEIDGIGPKEEAQVVSMLTSLAHRGPDGTGAAVVGSDACLGAVRLAIVDPSGSPQPIRDQSGSLTLVFNGQIFNYRELRRSLALKGYRFVTEGDGEVILAAYTDSPSDFVRSLDGMFAFALWDARLRRLILGRDRIGIKPLFFAQTAGRLAFASEAKALLPLIDRSVNLNAVSHYLHLRFSLPPSSAFSGVTKLLPGTMLVFTAQGMTQTQWSLCPGLVPADQTLDDVLGSAVSQCVSVQNGRAGLLLSGGVDSAAVAALAPEGTIGKAYTVGYTGQPVEDERAAARRVCELLGISHTEIEIEDDEVPSMLRRVLWHLEEPVFTPVTISTFAVCSAAAEDTNVVLSGDGSDELLVGYDHFSAVARAATTNDRSWHRDYASAIGWLPPIWAHCIAPELYFNAQNDSSTLISTGVEQGLDPAEHMRQFELRNKLPEYHLNRVDRLSMAHGLEVRVPFLRNGVVDWAMAVPARELAGDRESKQSLRKLLRMRLDPDVSARPKKKFSAPFTRWLQCSSGKELLGLLAEPRYARALGLRSSGLMKLVEAFKADPSAHASTVWGFVVLFMWYERFFDGQAS